jgi:N-sulfoglucosamine sulfohydrolase
MLGGVMCAYRLPLFASCGFLLAAAGFSASGADQPSANASERATAGAGKARPNILFALADDMGHASAYGTRWVKTPNFDRLASRGILFLNAYTPDAKCSPSRASILTGRNPWQNGAAGNHWPYYPAELKSWMEALSDGGYHVGFTGKGWGPGTLPPERRQITGKAYQRRKLKKPTSGISDDDYFANFRDFLNDCPAGEPFCFWYGGHEPHRPYEYGSGVAKGGYSLKDVGPIPSYWPDTEAVRNDLLDYAFEIAHFDAQLGKMVDLLQEQGRLDNTLVVVTGDNGPPFPRMKGHPFEEACHLPLAIMWPKGIAAPGRKVDAFVSFIDFAPTFLEVAGVDGVKKGMQPITGVSLTDLFANHARGVDRSTLLMGRERNDVRIRPGTESGLGYPVRAIRDGDFVLLHNFDPHRWPCGNPELGLMDTDNGPTKTAVEATGENSRYWQLCFGKRPADELYNLKTDADCVKNLAADPAYQKRLESMRDTLYSRLRQQGDPRMEGKGDVFDNYPSPHNARKEVTAPAP